MRERRERFQLRAGPWLALACAIAGCNLFRPASDAQVTGRVSLRDGSTPDRTVVFLVPIAARPPVAALPPLLIRQRAGGFEPDFAVAALGQPVVFSNQDETFHGVFSYSRPNEFELRPFGPGETRTVTFRHLGLVQTYSPMDDAMRGLILVVPDLHFALPGATGEFRIPQVPPGRYRVSVWAGSREAASREISLSAGEVERADFSLRAQ